MQMDWLKILNERTWLFDATLYGVVIEEQFAQRCF